MRIGIDCRKVADHGIGSYIRGLLQGLAGLDHEERFVLFVPEDKRDLIPADPRFNVVGFNAANYSLRELFLLARAATSERLALLHCPHYVTPFTAIPLVVTVHDLIHLRSAFHGPLERLYARWMIGRSLRKSAAVLTVSEAVAHELRAFDPSCVPKLTVTPNGTDPFFEAEPAEATALFLERLNLKPMEYFLFVGNEKRHKNVECLIEAFQILKKENASSQLVLAGSERIGSREWPQVRRVGFVPRETLRHLYRGALALVLPSLEEGFGLPGLEAMASGTAVIASDIPALRETTGPAALHFSPTDTRALAEAMRSVAGDPNLRGELIDRGRRRAKDFSWRECARQTLTVYQSVLGKTRDD